MIRYTEKDIDVAVIVSRATNRPARHVEELAEAIKDKGLMNRILVRPHGEDGYELIAGERRVAAHRLLGLAVIAARVYACTDLEAEELAEIDNLQREDLSPIEEGEAYTRLLSSRAVPDVHELARRVGRTETHVRQRMRLAGLYEPIRKMVESGELDLGAALLIAQTPDAVQKKIAPQLESALGRNKFTGGEWVRERGPRVTRGSVSAILSRHSHKLEGAPFAVADAELVPRAGACGTCPKRTGTQGVLVEVLEETDTCLDTACWDSKVAAHSTAVLEDAKKRGLKVLSPAEVKKAFAHGRSTAHDGAWKGVDETVYDSKHNPVDVKKLIDSDTPRALAVVDGHAVELVATKSLHEALAARAGVKAKAGAGASKGKVDNALAREEKKRREKIAVLKRSRDIALTTVREWVRGATAVGMEVALRYIISRADASQAEPVARARKLEVTKGAFVDAVVAEADRLVAVTPAKERLVTLLALATELAVCGSIETGGYSRGEQATPSGLFAFGVDLAAARRQAKAEIAIEANQKAKPKPAKAAAPAKPAAKAKAAKKAAKKSKSAVPF